MRIRYFFLTIFLLLTCILNANAQYSGGNVYTAARLGDVEAIQKFVESNPDQYTLNNALGAATVGEQLQVMKMLIDKGADVDHASSYKTSILINAIMKEKFDAAILLIEEGASVNIKGYQTIDQKIKITWFWTPLMCAAYKGHYPLVKLLLKKGADPAEEGWSISPRDPETSADIAAYQGHLKILKLLLKKGSYTNMATIFKATRGGHVDVVKYFVRKGFDPNKRESLKGRTLLAEAAWWGNTDLVAYLLQYGADPTIKDLEGRTPRGYAKERGYPEMLKLLR